MSTIVVGVDGSKGAQLALEWALDEARQRLATLRLLYVTHPTWLPAHVAGRAGGYAGPSRKEQQEAGERLLEEALPAGSGGVPVVREVLFAESPAQALIDASRDADLLVVGSRGLGGFEGLVLGSVSLQCIMHAGCPVAVVPPPEG